MCKNPGRLKHATFAAQRVFVLVFLSMTYKDNHVANYVTCDDVNIKVNSTMIKHE